MAKKVLLLGSTGKMGTAFMSVLPGDYLVTGKSSKDFDALDFEQVQRIIEENKPDIVINTIAFLGIDPCEQNPDKAFKLNTLYPKFLAELSNKINFSLVHFSTDAVFSDSDGDFYIENDCPQPLNIYGLTKYGGDCFITAIAKRFYIIRVSVLFGETTKNTQFVEKMLQKIKEGQKIINISGDIMGSPSYSKDIARQIKKILKESMPFGLYHVSNEGKASLYDLIRKIVEVLNLGVEVKKASYKDFPYLGIKNTYTPIKSQKISSLRPWQDAVEEYCNNLKLRGGRS